MKERKAAFLQLGITLAVMFLLVALGHKLDWIGKAFVLIASAVVLWKIVFGSTRSASMPTWIDALPRKWQKKVLGENDDAGQR